MLDNNNYCQWLANILCSIKNLWSCYYFYSSLWYFLILGFNWKPENGQESFIRPAVCRWPGTGEVFRQQSKLLMAVTSEVCRGTSYDPDGVLGPACSLHLQSPQDTAKRHLFLLTFRPTSALEAGSVYTTDGCHVYVSTFLPWNCKL